MIKLKYTLEKVKSFSPKFLMRLIQRAKKFLKNDEVMKSIFKEYEIDISELDLIPMKFADLDVSARTDHGIIYLNYKLLCDGDFFKDYSYLIHEVSHVLQQCTGDGPTKGDANAKYLDIPEEQEGFSNQVAWFADNLGVDFAEDYVEKLLDFHGIKGKEKKEKAKILTEKVD